MVRRRPVEEPENHERWLVSYADFITLLFAFFVVMYSVSSVNEGKFRVLSDTLVAAFKPSTRSTDPIQIGKLVRSPYRDDISPLTRPVPIDLSHHGKPGSGDAPQVVDGAADPDAGGLAPPPAVTPPPAPAAQGAAAAADSQAMADLHTVASQVEARMAPLIEQDLVNVRMGKSWVEIEFNTSILFDSGAARLSSAALPVSSDVAATLVRFPHPVQVEGFTDDVPINTAAFPSNWELSAARAASVVHLFMKAGLAPQRMVAIGYGEYRPIADNDTPEGRRRNRRVVLVIPAEKDARQILDLQRLSTSVGGAAASAAPSLAAPAPSPYIPPPSL